MKKALILFLTITMPIWFIPVMFMYITYEMFEGCYKTLTEIFDYIESKK